MPRYVIRKAFAQVTPAVAWRLLDALYAHDERLLLASILAMGIHMLRVSVSGTTTDAGGLPMSFTCPAKPSSMTPTPNLANGMTSGSLQPFTWTSDVPRTESCSGEKDLML